MLRSCLSFLAPAITAAGASAAPRHTPYRDPSADHLYNLLFCDDPAAFAPRAGQAATPWQQALYGSRADAGAVRRLADDDEAEARVRLLAWRWLQRHGHDVPARRLLGVVLEVPLDAGLDVLAAYADGNVRHLHHTGAVSIVEGPVPALRPAIERLLDASRAVVERIGPWDRPRLPAPQRHVRMSFLASDGLFFGEGPMEALQGDGMAAPVLAAGTALLRQVVDLRLRKAA